MDFCKKPNHYFRFLQKITTTKRQEYIETIPHLRHTWMVQWQIDIAPEYILEQGEPVDDENDIPVAAEAQIDYEK